MANIEQIKKLREETGISIGECNKALGLSKGDMQRAKEILKEWGKEVAAKKSERQTGQGIIDSYIHANGKIGVMIELRCETDFVAKSADFKCLAHELCLQFAAMGDEQGTLLAQPWIKDPSKSVKNLIDELISKVGENITLGRVVRYEI
jgi:elongation factor Ts